MSDDELYLHKNNTGLVQCFVAVPLLVHVSKIKEVVGRWALQFTPIGVWFVCCCSQCCFFFLQMLSSNPVPCSKYIHVIQMVFHPYQYDLQPCYIYTECKSNDFCFSAQPHPPLPSYMLLSTFLVKKEGSFSFRISVISNQLFINLTDLIYLDLGNNLIG